MRKTEIQNKFVKGPIGKSLLTLMIPIVLGNLLQTAYNLTDTFWVGRLGAPAVAAVSISFPIIFLIISIASGIGLAGSVLVSQYKGKKDYDQMSRVTGQTLLMAFVFAIIFSVIGYFLADNIISLLGAKGAVIPLAVSYLKYSIIGIVFVFGYMVFQEVLRGAGDAKTPFFIVLMTVLLNLVLDPLFIFGFGKIPAFGVSGAAVSTICTQGVALFIGLIILFKGKEGIKLKTKLFRPNFSLGKRILKLGIPTSLEQSSRSLEMTFMTMLVASFGTIALAGFGIGTRIFSFVIIPAIALAVSTGILVGQNIGAKQLMRARKIPKYSMKLGFFALLGIGILLIIFAKPISSAFIPGELEAINIATQFLRIISLTFCLIGVQMSILGALRGAGRTGLSMRLTMFQLGLQLIIALLLAKFFSLGLLGVWISYPISQIIGVIASLYFFYKIKWEEKELI